MRYALVVLWMLFWSVTSAFAQVSIGIGLPGVSIGINLPLFPELIPVPGYPVYYAPRLDSNYFFYDGMYWVYQRDNWYASSWYNGPWGLVEAEVVPPFVLRIPVRYYRDPPAYFRGWRTDAPPRWGEHWGNDWERHRSGWDRWNRNSVAAPAPLPVYQRQYSGDRYPRVEQQRAIHSQNYAYQPREAVVRQHYEEQAAQRTPAPAERGRSEGSQERNSRQPDMQRSAAPPPLQQQRGAASQDQRQQPQQPAVEREQRGPRSRQDDGPQGREASQEFRRGPAQEQGRERGEERAQERGHERGQERGR